MFEKVSQLLKDDSNFFGPHVTGATQPVANNYICDMSLRLLLRPKHGHSFFVELI